MAVVPAKTSWKKNFASSDTVDQESEPNVLASVSFRKNPLVPNYIASLPIDPRGSGESICVTGCTTNAAGITTLGTTNTGYYVQRSAGNRIEIGACAGEQTTSISVKR